MLLPIQAAGEFIKGLQPKEILSGVSAYARTTIWNFVSIQPETGFFKRVTYTQFFILNVSPFVLNHFSSVKKLSMQAPFLICLHMENSLPVSF